MKINLIAAVGSNWELGYKNKLPWKCPEDLEHFKQVTINQTLIMGRKTFDSLRMLLTDRIHIVLTNDLDSIDCLYLNDLSNVYFVNSIEKALKVAKQFDKKTFVMGGAQIYAQFIEQDLIDKVYLSVIPGTWKADIYFPNITIPFTAKITYPEKMKEGSTIIPIFYFWETA